MFCFSLMIILQFKALLAIYSVEKLPTILISVLVRNKAHTLPYFLTLLDNQDYDKQRLSLIITSDHNEDQSLSILDTWLSTVTDLYHSVQYNFDNLETKFDDEKGVAHWSPKRFAHIISLREEVLDSAKRMWADFVMFLDSDVFLTNPRTLLFLVSEQYPITAPMLRSNGLYSNFWCGMSPTYYYERTEDYKPILTGQKKGCFPVPMVHSAVLVNMRKVASDELTFNSSKFPSYKGPIDDIITFAVGANLSGIPLHICNSEPFGFIMVPLEKGDTLEYDLLQLTNLKLEAMVDGPPFPVAANLEKFVSLPSADRIGLDRIYVVNLLRRPERRKRMQRCLEELGLDITFVDAVDGRSLDEQNLDELGIRFMPEYKDPYHHRPMTKGEIGCFLSHYNIWKEAVERKEARIMVLEDDVRFEPFFKTKVEALLRELDLLQLDWDLVYLGRKRLKEDEEWVDGSKLLVHVTYSYWTLGYLLTQRGAEKLLRQNPLANLIPVDEYIPIMFDKHPEDSWKAHFPTRNLAAFSAAPLLLYPTHYTGEQGYISDTENSTTVVKNTPKEDL